MPRRSRTMKKSKRFRNAGYRLHLDRLIASGGKSIRTIKFPLENCSNGDLKASIGEKIKHDYERLYGPLNLSSYINNPNRYSLLDFWIDLLKCGAIMKHSSAKLLKDLRIMSGEQDQIDIQIQTAIKETSPSFFKDIDFKKLKDEIIIRSDIRPTKKRFDIFNGQASEVDTSRWNNLLLKNLRGKSKQEQDGYLLQELGIDKRLYHIDSKNSFYLLPDISFDNQDSSVDTMLEQIENHLQSKLGNHYKKIEEYIGISDSQSGLSMVFGKVFDMLFNNQIDEIIKIFNNHSASIWQGKEDKLRERLTYLSEKAQVLGYPKMAKKWADYRTDFGGKIQSWISNGLRQDSVIKEHLFGKKNEDDQYVRAGTGHHGEIKSIKQDLITHFDELNNGTISESDQAKTEAIKANVEMMLRILKDEVDFDQKIEISSLDDYRSLLSQLRNDLNYIYQQEWFVESNLSKKERADEVYKSLFKELPKVPSFLGNVKTQEDGVYDKYLKSLERLKTGINFIETKVNSLDYSSHRQISDNDINKEKLLRTLQTLLIRYTNSKNSTIGRQIIAKSLSKFTDYDLGQTNMTNFKDYIFRSKRSRVRGGTEIKINPHLGRIEEQFQVLIEALRVNWGKYGSVEYLHDWVVLIEIEKIRFGLIVYVIDDLSPLSRVLMDDKLQTSFVKIATILNRYKPSVRSHRDVLGSVVQQAIFSELKGTISKMTTGQIINRYTVQVIDSEKKFPLISDIKCGNIRLGKKLSEKGREKYYISFSGHNDSQSDQEVKLNCHKKKVISKKNFKEESYYKNELLEIRTSKYQLQFLDNSFRSSDSNAKDRWADFEIKILSPSFIFEEVYDITWSDSSDCPTLKLSSDKQPRLFVSMPFEFQPKTKNNSLDNQKFLGVDIGEYGVATYLLDRQNYSDHKPETSFIYEKALRKIREGIGNNKSNQRLGTFSIPSTYVKLLRDNATNSIRNRIHEICVRRQANPVYEREVSHFESGSGKISKIYNSIKQSDVWDGTGANNLNKKLTWGDIKSNIGRNTGAYATSYICSQCQKSIYGFIDRSDYKTNYKVSEDVWSSSKKLDAAGKQYKHSLIVKLDLIEDKALAYIEQYSDNEQPRPMVGSNLKGKDAQKYIKKFTRPPLSVVLRRYPSLQETFNQSADDRQTAKDSFKDKSGSQAIFVCPFCEHIADADIQAAMWIALKGNLDWLADKKNLEFDQQLSKRWRGVDSKQSIKTMGRFAQENKIQPVGLNLKTRLS